VDVAGVVANLFAPKRHSAGSGVKRPFLPERPRTNTTKEGDMAYNFFDEREDCLKKGVELWPWASTRVLNAFHWMEIKTDQDINDAWFKGRFRNIPNLGKKSIKEIQVAMGLPDAGRKKCPHCGALV
jgi:hypothetical protein